MEEKLYFLEKTSIKLWAITWRALLQNGEGLSYEIEETYLKAGRDYYSKKVYLENGLGLEINLNFAEGEKDTVELRADVSNVGQEKFNLEQVTMLHCQGIGITPGKSVFFRQGWRSGSASSSIFGGGVDPDPRIRAAGQKAVFSPHPGPGKNGHYVSDMYGLILDQKKNRALLAGAAKTDRFFSRVYFKKKGTGNSGGELGLIVDVDGLPLSPGERIQLDPFWLYWGSPEEIHYNYLNRLGGEMGARISKDSPTVWAWGKIPSRKDGEQEVLHNLSFLNTNFSQVPLGTVHIDEGYQQEAGDWLKSNRGFSRGMGYVSEKIRDRDFQAGIGMAPFLAGANSQLFRENREWFVRDAGQNPLALSANLQQGSSSVFHVLDLSRKEVQDYLGDLFQQLAGEWGYSFFRLSYLYAAALPGERKDPSFSRAQSLRRGLEIIREAVGEEAYLLASKCPLGPAIGVVDAFQTGPETGTFWESSSSRFSGGRRYLSGTGNAIRNCLSRLYLHRRLWSNDPGLIFLGRGRGMLGQEEVLALATAVALNRGPVLVGDPLENIPPDRQEVLRGILQIIEELREGQVRVLDLLEGRDPEMVVARGPKVDYLAVFNLGNFPRKRRVDLREVFPGRIWPPRLVEFWSREGFFVEDGGLLFLGKMPPHSVRLFRIWQG